MKKLLVIVSLVSLFAHTAFARDYNETLVPSKIQASSSEFVCVPSNEVRLHVSTARVRKSKRRKLVRLDIKTPTGVKQVTARRTPKGIRGRFKGASELFEVTREDGSTATASTPESKYFIRVKPVRRGKAKVNIREKVLACTFSYKIS